MRERPDPDEPHDTPSAATAAVTFGTVPLPFLAIYAALFILHGWLRPVHPPDITSTQRGELIAGFVAAAIFLVLSVTIWMFLNRSRRWPFALGQLAVVVATAWVVADGTRGGRVVAVLVLVAAVLALVCVFAPGSWSHVGHQPPGFVRTAYFSSASESGTGDRTDLPGSSDPTLVEPSSLRRGGSPPG